MTQTQTAQAHTTAALRRTLAAQTELPLQFWLDGQGLVGPGYHVTEVKAVTTEAMDCGGQAATWFETVIQLMDGSAGEAQAGFMTTGKFLGIYDRVAAHIPVRGEAEVRFEYGNAHSPALVYHISALEAQPERIVVHLRTPGVQCKAGDACGAPVAADVAAEAGTACCTPAAGAAAAGAGAACCPPPQPDLISLS